MTDTFVQAAQMLDKQTLDQPLPHSRSPIIQLVYTPPTGSPGQGNNAWGQARLVFRLLVPSQKVLSSNPIVGNSPVSKIPSPYLFLKDTHLISLCASVGEGSCLTTIKEYILKPYYIYSYYLFY